MGVALVQAIRPADLRTEPVRRIRRRRASDVVARVGPRHILTDSEVPFSCGSHSPTRWPPARQAPTHCGLTWTDDVLVKALCGTNLASVSPLDGDGGVPDLAPQLV